MALLKDHLDFLDEIDSYILCGMFCELKNFTNFHLCKIMSNDQTGNGLLVNLLQSKDNALIKHIIDNTVSVTFIDYLGCSLIHYLFFYVENITLLNYFIEKYRLNLETETVFKNRPIFHACNSNLGSLEKVKYLVNKKVDLRSRNSDNHMPIHRACLYGSLEVIHFLLDHSIKLMDDDAVMLLIHIVCRIRGVHIIKNILPRIKSLSSSINLHNDGKLCDQIKGDIGANICFELEEAEDVHQFIIINC